MSEIDEMIARMRETLGDEFNLKDFAIYWHNEYKRVLEDYDFYRGLVSILTTELSDLRDKWQWREVENVEKIHELKKGSYTVRVINGRIYYCEQPPIPEPGEGV